MDKVQRQSKDLENSQTSVLKKLSQIEAQNITLGVALFDDKLPDLHEGINSIVRIVSELTEAFAAHREKFFADNKSVLLPTPLRSRSISIAKGKARFIGFGLFA